MDALQALGFARQIWPRLVAALVALAFCFFPQQSSDLVMHAAQQRAQRIVTALEGSLGLHSAPQQHRSKH
ncbi:MAG TPA: hypothetical protein VFZ29_05620 [Solirubrobacterales bacterium]